MHSLAKGYVISQVKKCIKIMSAGNLVICTITMYYIDIVLKVKYGMIAKPQLQTTSTMSTTSHIINMNAFHAQHKIHVLCNA